MKLLTLGASNAGKARKKRPQKSNTVGDSALRQEPSITGVRLAYPAVQLLGWAVAVLFLLSVPVTEAHREHGVWTELVWSEDRFEITHHMHLQDAERVLERLGVDMSLDSPEGLARLALYVEDRFLLSERGIIARLDLIGAETEGDFLYVFQEWHGSRRIDIPQIESTLLEDIYPDAVTWIRIEAPELNQTWSVGGRNSSNSE